MKIVLVSIRVFTVVTNLVGLVIFGRTCLYQLMRSNNFDAKVPGDYCTKVEALAKTITAANTWLVDVHKKTDF